MVAYFGVRMPVLLLAARGNRCFYCDRELRPRRNYGGAKDLFKEDAELFTKDHFIARKYIRAKRSRKQIVFDEKDTWALEALESIAEWHTTRFNYINIVPSCEYCNNKKGSNLPTERDRRKFRRFWRDVYMLQLCIFILLLDKRELRCVNDILKDCLLYLCGIA
jgi:hypothetical protein